MWQLHLVIKIGLTNNKIDIIITNPKIYSMLLIKIIFGRKKQTTKLWTTKKIIYQHSEIIEVINSDTWFRSK